MQWPSCVCVCVWWLYTQGGSAWGVSTWGGVCPGGLGVEGGGLSRGGLPMGVSAQGSVSASGVVCVFQHAMR